MFSIKTKILPYAIPCEIVPYIDEVDMIYSGRDVVYAKKELNFYIIKKG